MDKYNSKTSFQKWFSSINLTNLSEEAKRFIKNFDSYSKKLDFRTTLKELLHAVYEKLPSYRDWNGCTNYRSCKHFNPAINLRHPLSLSFTTIFSFDSKYAPSVKKWLHVTRDTVCFKNRDWIRFWSLVFYFKFVRYFFCCHKHCHYDCGTVCQSFVGSIHLEE